MGVDAADNLATSAFSQLRSESAYLESREVSHVVEIRVLGGRKDVSIQKEHRSLKVATRYSLLDFLKELPFLSAVHRDGQVCRNPNLSVSVEDHLVVDWFNLMRTMDSQVQSRGILRVNASAMVCGANSLLDSLRNKLQFDLGLDRRT